MDTLRQVQSPSGCVCLFKCLMCAVFMGAFPAIPLSICTGCRLVLERRNNLQSCQLINCAYSQRYINDGTHGCMQTCILPSIFYTFLILFWVARVLVSITGRQERYLETAPKKTNKKKTNRKAVWDLWLQKGTLYHCVAFVVHPGLMV